MTNLMAFIDGSTYAKSVCDHAAWLNGRTGGAVELVHVLDRHGTSSEPENLSGSIGLGARTALLEELAELDARKAQLSQKRGRAILDDARQRLREAGVDDVSTRLRLGDIVEVVEDLEAEADMIVIGKRGGGADFNRLHLGSQLERVLRCSHRPVLVTSRAFKPIHRFLVAFDGGRSVTRAVESIAGSRIFADLECELLRVGEATPESTRQMEAAARLLRDAGYQVKTKIESGQPEAVITREVETDAYELMIMGAFGHSRIRHLIIGSTTSEMIRSCKIPVLCFR